MSKRRIIAAFLALALAISMTACNKNKSLDSVEETTSQSSVTTTTTTTVSSTTTTDVQTTAETFSTKDTAVTNDKTILGNEIYLSKMLKLHKLEGMDDWIMNKGSKKDSYYSELYIHTEHLDVGYTIMNTENVPYEEYDSSTMPHGKLKYKDRTVTYIVTSCPELEKIMLFSRLMMYIDLPDNKTLFLSVSPGGKVRYKENLYKDFEKWVVDHADMYDSLSNNPEDYLFLFDTVSFPSVPEQSETTTTAQSKTATRTTIPSSPDRKSEISNKNIKLTIHDLGGFSPWTINDGSKDSIGHYATCRSELLDVEIVLVTSEVKKARMEGLEKRRARTYQETYKGMNGTAIEMLAFGDELTKRGLCSGFLIYFPWKDDLYLTLSVKPAGELLNNSNCKLRSDFEKFLDENKQRYLELSSDPLDYLFIFDAVDIK